MHKAFVILPALALVTACNKAPELSVDKAWVQLSPVRQNPSVAYFTVHGGAEDNKLLQVSSPVVIKTEMHESMADGGTMKMAPLQSVPVPAKGTLAFAPGGKHVMLWYVNPGITPGKTIPLVFTFANGDIIQVDAPTQAMGAPAPK